MIKVLKWIGIVLGGLVVLILLASLALYTKTRIEMARKYQVQPEPVAVRTDAASIARGHHLADYLCSECHGSDLSGDPKWFDIPGLTAVSVPNLTPGQGGIGSSFTDADIVRVLRHGVKPDGTSVFIMPAQDFASLSDQDLGDVIAYLRSLPPVDKETPEPHVRSTYMGSVLYGAGMFGDLLRAGQIERLGEIPAAPAPGINAAYGDYLVRINGCHDCHGKELAGGKPAQPDSPLAPNLTPGGELRAWSESDFLTALRTGVTPSGTQLRAEFMPWKHKGLMSDDELKAIWAYLRSLPALPTSTEPAE